jgi:hypothetical protein
VLDFTHWPGAFVGVIVSVREGYHNRDTLWTCLNRPGDLATGGAPFSGGPIYFQDQRPDYWQGADPFASREITDTLQEHLDLQISWNTPTNDYPYDLCIHLVGSPVTYQLLSSHNQCVVRVYTDSYQAVTTLALPTGLTSNFSCVIVNCGWQKIKFTGALAAYEIDFRYDAYVLSYTTGSGWTVPPVEAEYPEGGLPILQAEISTLDSTV